MALELVLDPGRWSDQSLGYLLALMALRIAPVSYVSSIRQISIVLGVVLGSLLLKEPFGRIRLVASLVMFVRVTIIALLG